MNRQLIPLSSQTTNSRWIKKRNGNEGQSIIVIANALPT